MTLLRRHQGQIMGRWRNRWNILQQSHRCHHVNFKARRSAHLIMAWKDATETDQGHVKITHFGLLRSFLLYKRLVTPDLHSIHRLKNTGENPPAAGADIPTETLFNWTIHFIEFVAQQQKALQCSFHSAVLTSSLSPPAAILPFPSSLRLCTQQNSTGDVTVGTQPPVKIHSAVCFFSSTQSAVSSRTTTSSAQTHVHTQHVTVPLQQFPLCGKQGSDGAHIPKHTLRLTNMPGCWMSVQKKGKKERRRRDEAAADWHLPRDSRCSDSPVSAQIILSGTPHLPVVTSEIMHKERSEGRGMGAELTCLPGDHRHVLFPLLQNQHPVFGPYGTS